MSKNSIKLKQHHEKNGIFLFVVVDVQYIYMHIWVSCNYGILLEYIRNEKKFLFPGFRIFKIDSIRFSSSLSSLASTLNIFQVISERYATWARFVYLIFQRRCLPLSLSLCRFNFSPFIALNHLILGNATSRYHLYVCIKYTKNYQLLNQRSIRLFI